MTRIGQRFAERFKGFLERWLPKRTKRLIMLVSFSACFKERPVLDDRSLKKLNELMNLCRSDKALELPVVVSRVIWRDTDVQELQPDLRSSALSESKLAQCVQRIKASVPAWLRYDEPRMEHDLRRLLEHRQEVL